MITSETVFILGAGASKDYGLPTGEELKHSIIQHIMPDSGRPHKIASEIGVDGINATWIREFAENLQGSSLASVDAWLDRHPNFWEIGKICICHAIAMLERADAIWRPGWYDVLWREMTGGVKGVEGLLENKVSFITFNYDRSLEEFLMKSAKATFKDEECAKHLSKLPIIHVYGQAGYLDWQEKPMGAPVRSYQTIDGAEDGWKKAKNCAQAIKILGEGKYDSEEFVRTEKYLSEARKIYFLGFGYNPENMRRLGHYFILGKAVFGTYYQAKYKIPDRLKNGESNGLGKYIPFDLTNIDDDKNLSTYLREIVGY